jgi:hypothetical protein
LLLATRCRRRPKRSRGGGAHRDAQRKEQRCKQINRDSKITQARESTKEGGKAIGRCCSRNRRGALLWPEFQSTGVQIHTIPLSLSDCYARFSTVVRAVSVKTPRITAAWMAEEKLARSLAVVAAFTRTYLSEDSSFSPYPSCMTQEKERQQKNRVLLPCFDSTCSAFMKTARRKGEPQ